MSLTNQNSPSKFRLILFFTIFSTYLIACTLSNENEVCNIVSLTSPKTSTNAVDPGLIAQPSDVIIRTLDSMFIQNDYAYLGTDTSFVILDISNPANPQIASSISLPVNSIEIVGSYAYLTGDGLHIFDISDPRNPVEVQCEHNRTFEFSHAVIADEHAYLPRSEDGLQIFDISNPSSLVEIGSYLPRTSPQLRFRPHFELFSSQPRLVVDVIIHDQYAYVAESLLGTDSLYDGLIRILDISDPAKPGVVGTYEMPNNAGVQKLMLSNHYLFASTDYLDTPATILLDISDPAHPFEMITPPMPDGLVAVSGNYIYFTTGSSGLQVWDISDPSVPLQFIWDDLHYGYAIDTTISGNYAFFTTQYGGFRIVDITDPRHPITISTSFE